MIQKSSGKKFAAVMGPLPRARPHSWKMKVQKIPVAVRPSRTEPPAVAAQAVSPARRVIGVDMTPERVTKARAASTARWISISKPPTRKAGDAVDLSGSLRKFIAALPPAYREPLVRHEFQGESLQEVATALDLSLTAAKSRVRRARLMLREMLDQCCRFEFDQRGKVRGNSPSRVRVLASRSHHKTASTPALGYLPGSCPRSRPTRPALPLQGTNVYSLGFVRAHRCSKTQVLARCVWPIHFTVSVHQKPKYAQRDTGLCAYSAVNRNQVR